MKMAYLVEMAQALRPYAGWLLTMLFCPPFSLCANPLNAMHLPFTLGLSPVLSRFAIPEGVVSVKYQDDIVVWANEQARLIRAGRFDLLDVEHIAEEIEDVGKSEQRELSSRMAVLLAHLLKWQFQPERRGARWERTIREQRKAVARRLEKTPSLKPELQDSGWWETVWGDAVSLVLSEVELPDLPEVCPWKGDEVMDLGFYPGV